MGPRAAECACLFLCRRARRSEAAASPPFPSGLAAFSDWAAAADSAVRRRSSVGGDARGPAWMFSSREGRGSLRAYTSPLLNGREPIGYLTVVVDDERTCALNPRPHNNPSSLSRPPPTICRARRPHPAPQQLSDPRRALAPLRAPSQGARRGAEGCHVPRVPGQQRGRAAAAAHGGAARRRGQERRDAEALSGAFDSRAGGAWAPAGAVRCPPCAAVRPSVGREQLTRLAPRSPTQANMSHELRTPARAPLVSAQDAPRLPAPCLVSPPDTLTSLETAPTEAALSPPPPHCAAARPSSTCVERPQHARAAARPTGPSHP